MQIRIEKKERQYYIFINGEASCSYFGYWENRWGYFTVTVLTIYNQKRLEITNRYTIFNPFNFDYDLLFFENNNKVKMKPSWRIDFSGNRYDLSKRENTRVLKKNGSIIATYNQDGFPFTIEYSPDENLFVLLAFILAPETRKRG